jgi:hypothetical protein
MCFIETHKRHDPKASVTVQAKRFACCQLPVASCQAAHRRAATLIRADVKANRDDKERLCASCSRADY